MVCSCSEENAWGEVEEKHTKYSCCSFWCGKLVLARYTFVCGLYCLLRLPETSLHGIMRMTKAGLPCVIFRTGWSMLDVPFDTPSNSTGKPSASKSNIFLVRHSASIWMMSPLLTTKVDVCKNWLRLLYKAIEQKGWAYCFIIFNLIKFDNLYTSYFSITQWNSKLAVSHLGNLIHVEMLMRSRLEVCPHGWKITQVRFMNPFACLPELRDTGARQVWVEFKCIANKGICKILGKFEILAINLERNVPTNLNRSAGPFIKNWLPSGDVWFFVLMLSSSLSSFCFFRRVKKLGTLHAPHSFKTQMKAFRWSSDNLKWGKLSKRSSMNI